MYDSDDQDAVLGTVEGILAEHDHRVLESGYWRCGRCHAPLPDGNLARHMAEVLRTSDTIAVIDLEVPTVSVDGVASFSDQSEAGTVDAVPGVVHGGGGWEWTPEEAIDVGRQWVSAGVWARAAYARVTGARA